MIAEPKNDVIPPAETDEQAFEEWVRLTDEFGLSFAWHALNLRAEDAWDPTKARENARAVVNLLRKAANALADATRPAGQPRVRELYSIHGEAAGVWFCEKCRYTCRTEQEATECCGPRVCEKCQTPKKAGSYFCDPCWREEQTEKAARCWAKAEPIEADAYTGEMVYVEEDDGSPYGGSHEGYFAGLEELGEFIADEMGEDGTLPTIYVYATTGTKMTFDADDEVGSRLESMDFFDEARSHIPNAAVEELQTFLDQWTDKYSPTGYWQDASKKIVGWEAYVPPAEESESKSDDDDQEEADA